MRKSRGMEDVFEIDFDSNDIENVEDKYLDLINSNSKRIPNNSIHELNDTTIKIKKNNFVKKNILFEPLKIMQNEPLESIAQQICRRLHEVEYFNRYLLYIIKPKIDIILKALEAIGVEKVLSCFYDTQTQEFSGGLMTDDGLRRRTSGGVFFRILKEKYTTKEQFKFITLNNQKKSSKRKKQKKKTILKTSKVLSEDLKSVDLKNDQTQPTDA